MRRGQKQGLAVIGAIISGFTAFGMIPEQAPYNQIGLFMLVVLFFCIYMIFAAKKQIDE